MCLSFLKCRFIYTYIDFQKWAAWSYNPWWSHLHSSSRTHLPGSGSARRSQAQCCLLLQSCRALLQSCAPSDVQIDHPWRVFGSLLVKIKRTPRPTPLIGLPGTPHQPQPSLTLLCPPPLHPASLHCTSPHFTPLLHPTPPHPTAHASGLWPHIQSPTILF